MAEVLTEVVAGLVVLVAAALGIKVSVRKLRKDLEEAREEIREIGEEPETRRSDATL